MRTDSLLSVCIRPLLGVILFGMGIVFVGFVSPSIALEVPALRSRVNDHAGMLSESTRIHLDSVLKQLEQESSTQIVILTIASLDGENLESFSIRVAQQWKVGQKGLDNGAILFIAKADRRLRIEVGYGLEEKLTDLVCGRIIRDIIVPEFKAGQFDQGVLNGVVAMMNVVTRNGVIPEKTAGSAPLKESWSPFGNTILMVLVPLALCLPILIIMAGIVVSASPPGARYVKVHRHRRDSSYPAGEDGGGFGRDFGGSGGDSGTSGGDFSGGGGEFGGGGASGSW